MEDEMFILIVGGIVFLFVFMLPSIIAIARNHHYKWIIIALNIFGSMFFGMGWLVSFIWSVWPSQTGLIDPLVNDPTSNSREANEEIYQRYGENISNLKQESKNSGNYQKYCSNCGAGQSQGDVKFCSNCGQKLF